MNHYTLTWEIDVEAATPEEAAQEAWNIMRRPGSSANVFNVSDEEGNCVKVDLQELIESS
ncbi:hypothetical protein [Pseudovibrio sp. Ad37]|uniref:hypothetical protein n=1 Tax=Pseudovibrio sp. Ad37 TaxID=989422 RepID=UPI0007AEBC5D|nr:hypothetical protein [Pseudovibrio sp. Ad37]KZL24263.1 hypothetical protein PsAD37_02834 [Pseudovibrio sp. Ad37]